MAYQITGTAVSIQMISPVKGKPEAYKEAGHIAIHLDVSIQMISPVKGKSTILNPSWAKVSQAVCEGQQN
jgi:hypothetical protein